MTTAPPRRPRPVDGDSSDVLAQHAALERYCDQLEAIALTLQEQNRVLAQALEWYANVEHYDLFGVAGSLNKAGHRSVDFGLRARQALKE